MDWLEVFISLTLLFAGIITLAFRNRRQYFIGFRVGYTYMSDKAWRKANTFAGLYMVFFSLFLLLLALVGVPVNQFVLVMIAGIIFLIFAGTLVARRAYEEEDISTEAPEKPGEWLEVDVTPYITAQLSALALYLLLVAFLWDKLPEKVAIHFDWSGKPDNFASKTVGVLLFPLIVQPLFIGMTYLLKEPAFAPLLKFSRVGWRRTAEFFTIMAVGIVVIDTVGLLYNAGFVSSDWISYSVWGLLAIAFLGTYRIFTVKGNERV